MADDSLFLIDIDRILREKAPKHVKYIPKFVVSYLKRIVHQDELNVFLKESKDKVGVEFLQACLEFLDAKLIVKGEENLPKDGLYTFVSNHPLGGQDGVALGYVLGTYYGGKVKYMVNDLLMNLHGLAPLCIPINKTGKQAKDFPKMVEADHLAKRNIPYNASADYVDDLFEKFALYNIQASINLAKEKGTFGAYEGSDWSKGLILGRRQLMYAGSKYARRWNQVFADLAKYGIRNSQITAIAPNTSSSLIQGCTASVLPIYSKFFVENHSKGSVPNCPPFIKDKFWFYQENRNLSQQLIIEVMSRINKWIDTGISIELMYNLNRNIKARDIYDTIMDAWKKGIKTLYYTRTIQKDGSSAEKEECVSCAG